MGAIIAIGVLVVIVSVAMTTKQDRDEASRKLARWNPLFFAFIVAAWAYILWPRG